VINGKRIVVVMPAYNAERTLGQTFSALPQDVVDEVVLTDDASSDATARLADSLGIRTLVHEVNRGYGANQKTCYAEALRLGADVVVMLHPDYQYDPRLVTPIASMIASGVYDIVLASRILGGTARAGGMPAWKYIGNRILTLGQNLACGSKLSEFHTGYRAFSRSALMSLPLLANSNNFVFDNEVILQAIARKLRIGEISCPTSYHPDASSIDFRRSLAYAFGVTWGSVKFLAWRVRLFTPRILECRPGDFLASLPPLQDAPRPSG